MVSRIIPLTERIRVAIDSHIDGGLKPISTRFEWLMCCISPCCGIVEEVFLWILTGADLLYYELRQWTVTGGGIEAR